MKMPSAEQRVRASREQAILRDELWEAIERNVARWEAMGDEKMGDKMIAAVLMSVATSFSGEVLAMVTNAMGMDRDSLKSGAELIKNGALASAVAALDTLEAEENEQRH